jgi:hypothetical protein
VSRLLREQRGLTLMELLTASALSIIVLSATLFTYERFVVNADSDARQNDSLDAARNASDRLSRDLRNLASPEPWQPNAIEKATPYDIVFQNVNPVGPPAGQNSANVRRVRYCLNSTNPSNEQLWVQWQTWTTATPPALPSTGSCPDPAWPSANNDVAATHITNRAGGQNRPLFTYNGSALTAITSIDTQIFIDYDPTRSPPETVLQSGVFLRNQNQAPTASFTATPGGSHKVVLNGSASSDPEGQDLTYKWYDGTTLIGTGITFTYAAPCTTTCQRTISLKVFDPAGLEGDAPAQTVTVT